MAKGTLTVAVSGLLCALLVACGGSLPDSDHQATEIAAGIEATLTAIAPLPTLVVTPLPDQPAEPDAGVPTVEVRLEGSVDGTPGAANNEGRIAFVSSRDGNQEIYVMNPDGSDPIRLTNYAAPDYAPAWSPGGMRIAFVSERDGDPDIFVMNYDGSEQVRLTDNPGKDLSPAWSPDGSRIAYTFEHGDIYEIYVMIADGSDQVQLANGKVDHGSPTWSPDGQRIAMTSYPQRYGEIYALSVDGTELENLTNHPISSLHPAWSPDGSRIAFVSRRDEDDEVYVMHADGGGQTHLTWGPGSDWHPAWSPDGSRIVFEGHRDGVVGVYAMGLDGSGLTLLSDKMDGEPSWGRPPTFHADDVVIIPQGPRFNPEALQGDGPWCFNRPDPVLDREWQGAAGGGRVVLGDSVEISLRNKWGEEDESYLLASRVIAPDETQTRALIILTGSEEAQLVYPDDFVGANTGARGVYTIIWEMDGGFLYCDGFTVIGGAS